MHFIGQVRPNFAIKLCAQSISLNSKEILYNIPAVWIVIMINI